MATNNYLITGYWGEPHVTAENDRGINAGIFGAGRFVLPVGERFKAEYIGNNTIRIYDGKLMNNGAAGGIPAGEFVDLLITNANQNMKRNDLIVFQYEQDTSTLVERGTFVVVQGTESSGTAVDPALTQQNLLSGEAVFDQMALWRISVSGATIAAPVQVFEVAPSIGEAKKAADSAQKTADSKAAASHNHSAANITSGVLPVARGGTGKGSVTSGNFLVGNGTGDLTEKTPAEVMSAIGAAASSHKHATSDITSGTLGVARGGTGKSTLGSGKFLLGNGTSAVAEKSVDEVKDLLGVEVGKWHTVEIIPFDQDLVQEFSSAITKTLPVPMDFSKYNYEFQAVVFGFTKKSGASGSSGLHINLGTTQIGRSIVSTIQENGSQTLSFPETARLDGYLTDDSCVSTRYGKQNATLEYPYETISIQSFSGANNTFDSVKINTSNSGTHQTYGIHFQYRAMEKG